jgi:hypothetical protein
MKKLFYYNGLGFEGGEESVGVNNYTILVLGMQGLFFKLALNALLRA